MISFLNHFNFTEVKTIAFLFTRLFFWNFSFTWYLTLELKSSLITHAAMSTVTYLATNTHSKMKPFWLGGCCFIYSVFYVSCLWLGHKLMEKDYVKSSTLSDKRPKIHRIVLFFFFTSDNHRKSSFICQ